MGCTNVIQVDFRFVVILIDSQLSWNVLLLLCIVSKLHSWFVILPGNNEYLNFILLGPQNKEMKIITFKDAPFAVVKTMSDTVYKSRYKPDFSGFF